ncbi:hypothetical protein DRQ19_01425 [bacterium]|nr:MAG: hypothetical protein DRQ19_01425 [bacterium]
MKKLLLLVVGLVLLLSLAVFAGDNDKVVATVNGEEITKDDVLYEVSLYPLDRKEWAFSEEGLSQILDNIIERKLLVKEARVLSLDTVDAVKRDIARAREDILIKHLLSPKVQAALAGISEDKLRAYYDENDTLFIEPEKVHVHYIVTDSLELAKEIYKKLKEGESFESLARKHSISSERDRGGDAGYLTKDMFRDKNLADTAFSLKLGEISDIITSDGLHYIMKVTDKIPSYKPDFDDIKDNLSRKVAADLQNKVVNDYKSELRKKAKISIDNSVLYSIQPKTLKPVEPTEK